MEAIGYLASGISHEINTPSQYIGDNLVFLGSSFQEMEQFIRKSRETTINVLPEESSVKTELEDLYNNLDLDYLSEEIPLAVSQSREGIGKITKIVHAMKDFSMASESQKFADINNIIESIVTVSINEWKYVADIDMRLASNLPPVHCYPGDIRQAMLSIIINAARNIEKVVGRDVERKGLITIETSAEGDHVSIYISDSTSSRSIKAIYSSKTAVNENTELSTDLTQARTTIVNKHQGFLSFHEDREHGQSTVYIELPVRSTQQDDDIDLALIDFS